MSFTTQGFINKIEFSYFKTYEEYLELKRFLEKNEYDYIITNKGVYDKFDISVSFLVFLMRFNRPPF